MLRELADEGRIERRRKKLHHAGTLPAVVLADITARDRDGELVAVPCEWDADEHGEAPRTRILVPRNARPGEVAGVGDRALIKTEEVGADGDAIRHRGRVIKLIERARQRVLGIFRTVADGGRLVPIDKKNAGRELTIAPHHTGGAQDGDLIAVEVQKVGRFGLPVAHVKERLGSLASEKAASLIAIHAHGIPHAFTRQVLHEAERARPATLADRGDWREVPLVTIDPVDAKDHDDAVFARHDTDVANPGGFIIDVAIADVAHYVRPGSALDREALARGNSTYFPDRVVPMLPERLSADLCSLRENEDRPCVAVRMTFDLHGKKLRHEFLRGIMRSAARLTYAEAQRAFDGKPDKSRSNIAEQTLRPLWNAYRTLAEARDHRA